ncbi:MAG TPA: GNAT family N-acetyltransferase [Candidatus Dormibacteraeota bacterium]|nr:GNAT family N-acetyltransferase [Candidatus Dormibacteraeota bacterium]
MTLTAGSVIWYARRAGDRTGALDAYVTADFPDGTLVDADELSGRNFDDLPALWHAQYEVATGRLQQVNVVTPANRLWYVETPEPDAEPPAVTLVAFDTNHFPAGRLIDHRMFVPLPIRSDEQVGAIRWWPGTGQIHQVYVQPGRRRQGIATTMVYAASAHLIASGSPNRIWASGDRTDLGEALAAGLPHPQRVRTRRRSLPPMTPAEEMDGIPERNLFPSR